MKVFLKECTQYQITKFDESTPNYHMLFKLAKQYDGTPYDLEGAIGMGIGEDWQQDTDFWCSIE